MRHTKGRADEADESEIDLTPMLDVVFIMLIFFIVTASFVKEAGIEVNRPESSDAPPSDAQNILIKVTAANEIWLGQRRIDIRSVRSNIERMHAENPEAAVVISSHKDAFTDTIADIADQARQASVFDVSLTTTEE